MIYRRRTTTSKSCTSEAASPPAVTFRLVGSLLDSPDVSRPWWCAGVAAALTASLALVACGGGGSALPERTTVSPRPLAASAVNSSAPPTAVAAARPASSTPPTTAKPDLSIPCRVAYLGDSVGYGTLKHGLTSVFGAMGCSLVWTASRPGMETSEAAALLAMAKPRAAERGGRVHRLREHQEACPAGNLPLAHRRGR